MTSSNMARNSPASGAFVTVSQIFSSTGELHDMTVRVTGRISNHDYVSREAMVTDLDKRTTSNTSSASSQELIVDTTLVEPVPACRVVQFIGEMDCVTERGEPILRARVARDVDGLDLTMFSKAYKLRSGYLASRDKPA